MSRGWKMIPTEGAPTEVRRCSKLAAVPVLNMPAIDLCHALLQVAGFSLGMYAKNKFTAILAIALERSAGPIDMGGIGKAYRRERREQHVAIVQGEIVIAKGRSDPQLLGGQARLLQDVRRWEAGELDDEPVQLKRLKELEAAGVDVIELPSSTAVDLRYARINLAQPVAICRDRFRFAEASGRVNVQW